MLAPSVLSCILLLLVQQGQAANENDNLSPRNPFATPRVEIGGKTFYFGTYLGLTWSLARDECASLGMQLATLDTEERYTMVTSWITDNPSYDYWLWTSGQKNPLSAWRWNTTGLDFKFTSWAPGFPDRGDGLESCMNFSVRWGGWDDDNCDQLQVFYLCESLLG